MKEAIQLISLRAKWKKVLKGRPTTHDLKNYLRDVQQHHGSHSEIEGQLS